MKFSSIAAAALVACSTNAVEDSQMLDLAGADTAVYVAEMVGVFIGELVYLNRLDSITDCAVGAPEVVQGVQDVIELIMNGQEIAAMSKASTVAVIVSNEIKTCKGSASEVMALGQWFVDVAGSKQKMVDAATANAFLHAQEIQRHVEDVWDVFFAFNDPLATGKALGQTAFWALGPVGSQNATI